MNFKIDDLERENVDGLTDKEMAYIWSSLSRMENKIVSMKSDMDCLKQYNNFIWTDIEKVALVLKSLQYSLISELRRLATAILERERKVASVDNSQDIIKTVMTELDLSKNDLAAFLEIDEQQLSLDYLKDNEHLIKRLLRLYNLRMLIDRDDFFD